MDAKENVIQDGKLGKEYLGLTAWFMKSKKHFSGNKQKNLIKNLKSKKNLENFEVFSKTFKHEIHLNIYTFMPSTGHACSRFTDS